MNATITSVGNGVRTAVYTSVGLPAVAVEHMGERFHMGERLAPRREQVAERLRFVPTDELARAARPLTDFVSGRFDLSSEYDEAKRQGREAATAIRRGVDPVAERVEGRLPTRAAEWFHTSREFAWEILDADEPKASKASTSKASSAKTGKPKATASKTSKAKASKTTASKTKASSAGTE